MHPTLQELIEKAAELSKEFPAGTEVRYWIGDRSGDGEEGKIRSRFKPYQGRTVAVWLEGVVDAIDSANVEKLTVVSAAKSKKSK